jgi:GAF domain-containing protein
MPFSDRASDPEQSNPPPGEPLVPLLRVEQALSDPDALATWHAALSNALSADIPHDLLGLWLYPWGGGVALLGPEALAQDSLVVPLATPQVQPGQVAIFEATIRRAGYASVACLPIRSGRRDVGLLLAAALEPSRYGDTQLMILEVVAQRLAPMLGRLARQWGTTGDTAPEVAHLEALVDAVTFAGSRSGTPQLYVAELGRALEPVLPHDLLELLVADAAGTRVYRLGEHTGGPLWADPSLEIGREYLDLEALFGGADRLVIADTYQDSRWPRGYFTVEEPAGAEPRAVVGARVHGARGLTAYLLAGSVSADFYDHADAARLARVAGLVTAQISLLVSAATLAAAAPRVPTGPEPISALDAAEQLATGIEFAETTRRVADLAARFLPFDAMHFALRLSEGDRVVLLQPGESRALPDLPLVPVGGTALAAVLQGEIPHSFLLAEGEARLIVPLRVAGRVHGAMVLTARHPAILREVHLRPAQQLADVIAAHLELLRRTALLPPPYLPGWKKIK